MSGKHGGGRFDRVRWTFLTSFTVVTFTVALAVAVGLSELLLGAHRAAVQDDLSVTAAGQVSALLTEPLSDLRADSAPSGQLVAALKAAQRIQYVLDVRVYRANGTALAPGGPALPPSTLRATLQLSNIWSDERPRRSGAARTTYLPFVTPRAIYVIAIDVSEALVSARLEQESRLVVTATAGGIAIIFFALVTLAAGASRELERRRRLAEGAFVQTLGVLAQTIDCRDPYTAGHSHRVARYSELLARELRLPARTVETTAGAALLHDLGKIGVPDAVLLKPARLDASEREVIEQHPTLGAKIIEGIPVMDDLVPCVLHHHERVDGRGYPDGLQADEIPVGARIIAVADAFDAMTTDRPYRRALSSETAIAELRRNAGAQFDPKFVETFATLVARGAIVPPAPREDHEEVHFGGRALVTAGARA